MRGRWVVMGAAVAGLLAGPAHAESKALRWTTFLHTAPDPSSKVMQEVSSDQVVDVIGCRGAWCEVRFDDARGWLAQSDLAAPPRAVAEGPAAACSRFAQFGWPRKGDPDQVCVYSAH